jgi:hypothetical protein
MDLNLAKRAKLVLQKLYQLGLIKWILYWQQAPYTIDRPAKWIEFWLDSLV